MLSHPKYYYIPDEKPKFLPAERSPKIFFKTGGGRDFLFRRNMK